MNPLLISKSLLFRVKRVPIFKSRLFREKSLLETTKFQKSYGLNGSFRTQKTEKTKTNKQQQQGTTTKTVFTNREVAVLFVMYCNFVVCCPVSGLLSLTLQ